MPSQSGNFSIGQDGAVGRVPGDASTGAVETNVVVWAPALPRAFEKARDATIFTRLGTRHSSQELKTAFEATPDVDQTFTLSVNNVILVFSASEHEHNLHCRKVLEMLEARSMAADTRDCVFNCAMSTDAGIRLEPVGNHRVYMVVNEGAPRRR